MAVATRALICSFVSCWEASSELLRSATLTCSGRSQAQLLAPADHERVIVAVADGKPLREHHSRDGLVPGEQAARVASDDPGAVPVRRGLLAALRGRGEATVDLQGHGVVVDLG